MSEKNCSCPKPCEVTSYETRLSYAQYPSEHSKEILSEYWAKRYIKEYYETNPKEAVEAVRYYMGYVLYNRICRKHHSSNNPSNCKLN